MADKFPVDTMAQRVGRATEAQQLQQSYRRKVFQPEEARDRFCGCLTMVLVSGPAVKRME